MIHTISPTSNSTIYSKYWREGEGRREGEKGGEGRGGGGDGEGSIQYHL